MIFILERWVNYFSFSLAWQITWYVFRPLRSSQSFPHTFPRGSRLLPYIIYVKSNNPYICYTHNSYGSPHSINTKQYEALSIFVPRLYHHRALQEIHHQITSVLTELKWRIPWRHRSHSPWGEHISCLLWPELLKPIQTLILHLLVQVSNNYN